MSLPLWPFNNTIPFATNNPSSDQGDMLENNQSDESIWAVDHFGYNVNSGGYHQQVRMANRTTYEGTGISPNPPTVIATFGGLYCDNTINTGAGTETGLWYTPDNYGQAPNNPKQLYQLTRTINTAYSLFAKNTNNYNAVGVNFTGGWTFLPGGLLLQYGLFYPNANLNAHGTVIFPVPFNAAPFKIDLTLISKYNGGAGTSAENALSLLDTTLTNTQFIWNLSTAPTSAYTGFYWSAIGF